MGIINILLGALVLVIGLVIFMQPIGILQETANDVIGSNNSMKYGTNPETGLVEPVGQSIFAPDLVVGLIGFIGIAMVVGFIIYAVRGAPDDPGYGGYSGSGGSGGELSGL